MAVESPRLADDEPGSIPPPPTEQPPAEPSAVGPTEPPAAAAPPAPRAARNRPNLLWYAALLVAAVVTLGGLGMLYLDDTSWQHQAKALATHNAALQARLITAETSLSDSEQQVQALKAELQHPHLAIWNVQQNIAGADWYLAGGVPDTFTYHLSATATGPMSVSILTFQQFAAAIECIDNGGGRTNYCMHHSEKGTVKSWLEVRSVSYDFHLAEGCANYLVVFTAAKPVTVVPDVSITYNPAPTFTGDC
jgi:hypothetical protein